MTEEYLKTPLVVWIQTFSIETISYKDIIDGYFLNEVFQQIDNKCTLEGTVGKGEDANDRVQNWEILMKNIRNYYQEVLQQFIILKPPDIFLICYHPDSASTKDHVDSALLLLLGCAVQCEERGGHIQTIKELDVDVQHSIMQYIKEVTDFSKAVLNVNIPLKDIDDSTLTLYTHLSNLINQRDAYIQEIKALHHALNVISIDDYGRITLEGHWSSKTGNKNKTSNRLSLINLEMSSLIGQAEYKAIVRKLKQELLDKGDLITELEDESDLLKKNIQKLKIENFDLTQQARMGKFYRDELDIYKEKAEAVEKLERELQKHKDQMVEFDYLKDRVEELQVDNCVHMDSKKVLEDQLETAKKRIQHLLDSEVELLKCRTIVEDFNKERQEYEERMRHLAQKVEHFEREKETRKRISYMEDSLHAPLNFDGSQDVVGSLADQLLQASQSQIIALEAKLQKLELEMEGKFYFSENVLKAFDLGRINFKNDDAKLNEDDDVGRRKDDMNVPHDDADVIVRRNNLEREILKRLSLLKDDNLKLKDQVQSANQILEQTRDKVKSLELANGRLTTEKQQLVLISESSERKVRNLLEERDRLEAELMELKKMADVCLNRTKDLEYCLEEVKAKDESYLQEKLEFEKELKRLKSVLKEKLATITELESNANDVNVELVELRKASDDLKQLEIKSEALKSEMENLKQNSELDRKLITSLREGLVNEKIKTQNLNEEQLILNKRCEAFISGEFVPPKLRLTEKLLEEKIFECEEEQKKVRECEESLDEYKVRIEGMQTELDSLLKKEEMNATKDRTLIVTQRYGQSLGATQEIMKLKENLTKAHQHRDSLIQEVTDTKKQLDSLRSTFAQRQQDDSSYLGSLQSQLQKSKSLLASLQVEHSTILTRNAMLESQAIQSKNSMVEGASKMECLTVERNSLEDNCRALQKLHDKLGVEFERLQEDHGSLKGVHRLLKNDLKSAREKISTLEKSLEKMKVTSTSEEIVSLKEENSNLSKTVGGLENDNTNMSNEMMKNRVEIGRLRDSLQGLQRQMGENRSNMADLNVEIERLRRIEHMYDRTEEENQILTDQLRMYKTGLEDGTETNTENHQQQQKSLIERLSEMKGRSTKDNQSSKKKTKNDLTNSAKKNQSSSSESKSSEQSDSILNLKKDCVGRSPLRKSQDDFISIETTPTHSDSKTVSPFETTSKFGDWRIKTVFRKNKSVDSTQQTDKDSPSGKKSKRNIGTSDIDEETITLNQFLSECNQSPKSRRKFLIQKRVALDDDVFCDQNLTLDPRPPVIFESPQTLMRCGRSEGSIFGCARDRNFTPPKSCVIGRKNVNRDHESAYASKNKTISNSLHYSKSLQDNLTGGPNEKLKIRREFSGRNVNGINQNAIISRKTNFTKDHLRDDHQPNIVILRKKDPRELLQPPPRRKIFISDGSGMQAGLAVEDVPYHSSDGVVKNLIKSYQKHDHDGYQVQKDVNYSRLNSSQGFGFMRPKSAGPNQDKINGGRRFLNDQPHEVDNQLGNPKVCLVRPATATTQKVNQTSSNFHPLGINSRGNLDSHLSQTNPSQKSKTLYEYSCV